MSRISLTKCLAVICWQMMFSFNVSGQSYIASDQERAAKWVHAKFEGRISPPGNAGYLLPAFKTGRVSRNLRLNHVLNIAGTPYQRGLNLPSSGTVRVHLSRPASSFTAFAGVDSNDLTYYSGLLRGDVTVSVEVDAREVFKSPVMHEGMKAIPVDVNLVGAIDFTLRAVTGGHDWDQLDLADAKVKFKDGGVLSLDQLPSGPPPRPDDAQLPFSFIYGGNDSSRLLSAWPVARSNKPLDSERVEYTNIYQDPRSGLQVKFVGIAYQDFPTVEWVVYFKNNGPGDTPILEKILSLDSRFERNGEGEFVLHHNKGAPATPNDYQPYETVLGSGATMTLSGGGGRPSNKELPYMNLETPGSGVILAVGWPGQWSALLSRDAANGIHLRAGQEQTHFKLLPGEEVRTPLMVLQFWSGDWLSSQNMWRRWMIAHNMPHPNGHPPSPQLAANTSREFMEMSEATDRQENNFIDLYVANGLHPDYFWMDAGWYPDGGSWVNTGTWEVEPNRFPQGLRAVSDHARANHIGTIVWFEPERVTKGSWLYDNHPEWLLTAPAEHEGQLYDKDWRLLNLGNREARQWITDHVDSLITSQGIDLYRQDFNMDPLYFWRAADAPDRQGITENHYVTGYLAYWDELRRRHPGMLIDSCASGGRRNDIETLRRAVPLTRSDYLLEPDEPISQQMQTYGMALWIPYFGTGISGTDTYVFHSQMTPALVATWDLRRSDVDVEKIRKLLAQWKSVAEDYMGDFYPLTAYSLDKKDWAAMQFDRPTLGRGFIQAFRRSASPYEEARFKLRGLDHNASYEIENTDDSSRRISTGHDLMELGIGITLKQAPSSALLIYKRVDQLSGTKP